MATTTYGTPYVSGTDLVANWPAASLTVANSIDQAGYYVGRGTNTQTGSYTLVLTDAGKNITQAVNTANTITIPTNSSVAFPIGTRVNIINLGSGACTPTAAGGVTIAGTITALAINEYASLVKTGTNTWSYLAAATPAAPGLSLVTPTSVAGTGVTLSGGAVSFSGSTSVSVNGCFTATYDNYFMEMNVDTIATASNYITWRVRAAGTDVSSATYNFQNITASATVVGASRSTGATSGRVMYATLGESSLARIDYFNPARAYPTQLFSINNESVTTPTIQQPLNVNTNATAYDGLSFLCATAITGTLRIYGLRNS